jgi:hypothetical protein
MTCKPADSTIQVFRIEQGILPHRQLKAGRQVHDYAGNINLDWIALRVSLRAEMNGHELPGVAQNCGIIANRRVSLLSCGIAPDFATAQMFTGPIADLS